MRAYALGAPAERRLGTDLAGVQRRVDKHLPDIAGLLDPDQFDAIGRPGPGFLVVRGTAGSGKTTVALHRIAYLAYQDPEIDAPTTLFLTLSPALRDYVSHVLPGLGVANVRVLTFPEWAEQQVRRLFPVLPRERRMDTPDFARRLKLHPALEFALAEHVRTTPGPSTVAQAVDDWASVQTNLPLLEAVLLAHPANVLSLAELRSATDWCRARHEELVAFLEGDAESPAALDAEDDALLLRAWQRRAGPLPERPGVPLRYRHVAVDEVQDFSLLELRVIRDCLSDSPSMTLAGDTQQQTVEHGGTSSWAELLGGLELPAPELRTLRVAYRSTHEIVQFALGLLGPLREDETPPETTRSGPPVELFRFTDHGACVAFLATALKGLVSREPLASVVLLAPSAETAGLYARALESAEVPRLSWVQDQRFSFAPGIEIAEVADVKGLEFDYVVLLEASAAHYPETPAARRRIHVGATRAIHQLWLTSVATPSPLLRTAMVGEAGR